MKLLKALVISFSMYSGIPMPQFEWKEEDMKYMLCFFPWIGAVIGFGIILWSMYCPAPSPRYIPRSFLHRKCHPQIHYLSR